MKNYPNIESKPNYYHRNGHRAYFYVGYAKSGRVFHIYRNAKKGFNKWMCIANVPRIKLKSVLYGEDMAAVSHLLSITE